MMGQPISKPSKEDIQDMIKAKEQEVKLLESMSHSNATPAEQAAIYQEWKQSATKDYNTINASQLVPSR